MKLRISIIICSILLVINLIFILFTLQPKTEKAVLGIKKNSYDKITTYEYSTLSSKDSATVGLDDYRVIVLEKYFQKYDSPLQSYGNNFLQACKKYKAPADCTLLPAIAFVETRLCTTGISDKQFNCWGWGGSNENRIWFSSYANAIDTITKNMVQRYGSRLSNPNRIGYTYCGEHCHNWGDAVRDAQNEMNNISKSNNLPPLF